MRSDEATRGGNVYRKKSRGPNTEHARHQCGRGHRAATWAKMSHETPKLEETPKVHLPTGPMIQRFFREF